MGVRHRVRNDRAGEPPKKAHGCSSSDEEKRATPATPVMNRREYDEVKFGGHGQVRVMGKIITFISEVAPKTSNRLMVIRCEILGSFPTRHPSPGCACGGWKSDQTTEVKIDRR